MGVTRKREWTKQQEQELRKLDRDLRNFEFRRVTAEKAGRILGEKLFKITQNDTARKAIAFSSALDFLASKESDFECEELLIQWIQEFYWGKRVGEHLDTFKDAYAKLVKLGHKKDNPYVYGDMDCGVWYEPHEDQMIVALTVYCSMADDNTWLFILESDSDLFKKFHCRTCYPRARSGWNCRLSVSSYRRRKFKMSGGHHFYGDCRDPGYVFSWEKMLDNESKVDRATSSKVYWGLWHLRSWVQEILEEYERRSLGAD